MLKIGIDARMWREKGIGRYIRNLVRELAEIDTHNRYVLFCLAQDRETVVQSIPATWQVVTLNVKWYSWQEQFVAPYFFYRAQLDLLHVPHFNIPVFYRKPFIVTIHDLTHDMSFAQKASRLPNWLYTIKRVGYSIAFGEAVHRSKHVFTVSHHVKKALSQKYPFTEQKITVTYEAADQCSVQSTDKVLRVLSEFNVVERYFYYVGNAHPHKNLEFLLRSFQEFRKRFPRTQLVLSGTDEYFWPRLKKWATYEHLTENVIFTGFVDDYTKDALLKGAVSYLFPSLSEGFGLPMLEAMQCGCPVIASSRTSLPEIGGNAALYFDPTNKQELLHCMARVYESEDYRRDVISKGYARASSFSWKTMAEQTLEQYIAVID